MNDFASTRRNPLRFVLVLLAIFHAPVFAEEDTDNGKALFAERCAVCHGEYGQVSNNVIPNILGQYPGYLLTQMQTFLSDQAGFVEALSGETGGTRQDRRSVRVPVRRQGKAAKPEAAP